MSLTGKRIVITGGAGVLGQGVAQVAQSQGADVVLLDVEDFTSIVNRTSASLTDRLGVLMMARSGT